MSVLNKIDRYLNEAGMGLHLMKNPKGTYHFVGTVPVKLGWVNKDGSELSDEEADKVVSANNPAMLAKTRVFKNENDAKKAAKKLKVKIK